MQKLLYTSIQGIPRAYLRDMVEMCKQELYDVRSFKAMVVLAGTNDFSCDYSLQHMLSLFTAIITYIRSVNPHAQIGICGILPRPCDAGDPRTYHRIKNRIVLNTAILHLCHTSGVSFFKTDKALKGKGTDSYLFHTDLPHLSEDGLFFLKKWMEGRIACLVGDPPQLPDKSNN